MDNKMTGALLIMAGLLLLAACAAYYWNENQVINKVVEQTGSCYLDDGTCLHDDRNVLPYVIVGFVAAVVIALGAYLIIFERGQKEIVATLERQKHLQVEEERFGILLKGLDADEQKVLNAVREQDGISQSTLRLRTDMHKSRLSVVLGRLEGKGLVARVDKGKTRQVFLKRAA
jgi:hypothetical protein